MSDEFSQNSISLESDTFSIHGHRANDLDWFEFDTCIAGKKFKGIGGEDRRTFLERLNKILSKSEGKLISEIENFQYKELIGGNNAEYMGCLVFSGYKTFNFFRLNGELRHVLFLDRDMKIIAHAELKPDFKSLWLERLSQIK